MGYTGGTQPNPTYTNIGDHSEAIKIEYEPARISYERLVDEFWRMHNPAKEAASTRSLSIIFYYTDEQKKLALDSLNRKAAELGGQVFTSIFPASDFYPAEEYYQKCELNKNRT